MWRKRKYTWKWRVGLREPCNSGFRIEKHEGRYLVFDTKAEAVAMAEKLGLDVQRARYLRAS